MFYIANPAQTYECLTVVARCKRWESCKRNNKCFSVSMKKMKEMGSEWVYKNCISDTNSNTVLLFLGI